MRKLWQTTSLVESMNDIPVQRPRRDCIYIPNANMACGMSSTKRWYREIADQFMARKVDGVFLMPQEILTDQSISASTAIAEDFKEAGTTVVLIDNDIIRYHAPADCGTG